MPFALSDQEPCLWHAMAQVVIDEERQKRLPQQESVLTMKLIGHVILNDFIPLSIWDVELA
jgi:hypothetical protein